MKSLGKITIDITWMKIFGLASGLWLFLSVLFSVFGIGSVSYECFNGDGGIIIFLTTWLVTILVSFINSKKTKFFYGILFGILSLLILIGSLITSATLGTFLAWTIPSLIIFILSIIWVVQVFTSKSSKSKSKTDTKSIIY